MDITRSTLTVSMWRHRRAIIGIREEWHKFTETVKFWHMEGERTFGPNVVRATLVHGNKRTTALGVHAPSSEEDLF